MAVNNETGTMFDLKNIARVIKENSNAYFHVDMTQALGKVDIDLSYVDLVSLSAHKIGGLKGSGAFIKKKKINYLPIICGGSQESGMRAGTSNWPLNVMLAKTIRLALESKDENYKIVKKLNDLLRENVEKLDNVVINSPVEASPYIFNFSLIGKKGPVVVEALQQRGFAVSTISACSSKKETKSYVIESMFHDEKRATSSIRVSFISSVKEKDILDFAKALKEVLESVEGE